MSRKVQGPEVARLKPQYKNSRAIIVRVHPGRCDRFMPIGRNGLYLPCAGFAYNVPRSLRRVRARRIHWRGHGRPQSGTFSWTLRAADPAVQADGSPTINVRSPEALPHWAVAKRQSPAAGALRRRSRRRLDLNMARFGNAAHRGQAHVTPAWDRRCRPPSAAQRRRAVDGLRDGGYDQNSSQPYSSAG